MKPSEYDLSTSSSNKHKDAIKRLNDIDYFFALQRKHLRIKQVLL